MNVSPIIRLSERGEKLFLEAFAYLDREYYEKDFSALYEVALAVFSKVYGKVPSQVPQFQAMLNGEHIELVRAKPTMHHPNLTNFTLTRLKRDYTKANAAIKAMREEFKSIIK